MKTSRPLALFAALVLSGCGANLSGSVIQQEPVGPSGFTGMNTMKACQSTSGRCSQLEVESDGTKILRIRSASGAWIGVNDSGCTDGFCWAKDVQGANWRLQP